jgi:hypothetical protein
MAVGCASQSQPQQRQVESRVDTTTVTVTSGGETQTRQVTRRTEPSETQGDSQGQGTKLTIIEVPTEYGHSEAPQAPQRAPEPAPRPSYEQAPRPPQHARPPKQARHRVNEQGAALRCKGGDTLRVIDETLRNDQGAAIVASGDCTVELLESSVIGKPAIVLRDRAQVEVIESNVAGDVIRGTQSQFRLHGSNHDGRVHREGAYAAR